jgi:hypothetical protein
MNGIEYLNTAVRSALEVYRRGRPPRIATNLLS